ncbi:hypothetical protein O6H91_08G095500 [Diphasiastrum complanatum]|uniref:Uncharacterized protein n=2 Tax=Diphasiastrum complanatum TaxID=34168 RepID=A0ACC2D004_DIPCM|nr:hypothetical protein O6H91_08G095500 [Diphasiastrum complanatum]KAJ7547619.1 hypothetical protein O6H91_08G095500 [Diphasiastrum complanatum]
MSTRGACNACSCSCCSRLRRGFVLAPTLLLLLFCLAFLGANNLIFFESGALLPTPFSHQVISDNRESGSGSNYDDALQEEENDKGEGFGNRNVLQKIESVGLDGSKNDLKVYMYDLPRKFTYGVLEQYYRSRGMLTGPVLEDSSLQYPGNQHSAEWWLFSDLEKPQSKRFGDSLRVYDPYAADVFYVPFFSSLSLVVNPIGKASGGIYNDRQMQEQLMEWLQQQKPWQRNKGRDHVIICQDPNALHSVWDRVKNSILLISDFGRFKPEQASLVKDVVLPYTHRINSYTHENATLKRTTLLFFMGNRFRKEGGKIRDQLFQLLQNEKDMVIEHGTQSRENRRLAAHGMRTSKFCLHPAGDTPSACRLFDAIVSVCIPVIVSDYIELPFEDELDYREFSIFVTSSKAIKPGYLASLLRGIAPDVLKEKQQRLREVRKYFEYEEPDGAVHFIWRQVQRKIPMVRLMINREKRLAEDNHSAGSCSCNCSSNL